MVVGGYNWYRQAGSRFNLIYNETTLVALEPEDNPVPECRKKLGDFPFDTSEMHGGTDGGNVGTNWLTEGTIGFLTDGIPFVCAGDRVDETGSLVRVDNCYRYSPEDNVW